MDARLHPSHKERTVNKMRTTMTLETCCRCGQAIGPDEPYMQNLPRTGYGGASVDIDAYSRRAISSQVKTVHVTGPCDEEARRRERAEREARMASLNAA